jgi:hydroxyacylglutathione hydrolase
MIVNRFYDAKLAQASYLIGCPKAGAAIVIDPTRDVEAYVRAADAGAVRVTHVTETHIHADFVSGARELASRTGAQLLLSDEGDADWKYAYAAADGARLIRGGDRLMVGAVQIDVVHTPGHTPEHLSFLVTDTAVANEPMAVVTGDFVFVGDVGRPDLLERAARQEGTMEASARALFHSLKRFKAYPDWLQIWPGHGAGSACGKGLGAVPQSTVGYERRFNWGLQHAEENAFVGEVLVGQPEPPRYFAEMKRINKLGPRLLHGFPRPERMRAAGLEAILASGATVIDTRHGAAYAATHIPGTINVPLDASFTTWAGWLVPYDRDFYLIIDDTCSPCLAEAVRDLAMIGLDRLAGFFGREVIETWRASGYETVAVRRVTPGQLQDSLRAGRVAVIDVRGRTEWEAGHIPGAVNMPVGHLAERVGELPADVPLVVQCRSGARSAIAASVLESLGRSPVLDLGGGLAAWEQAGYPVELALPPGVGR